MEGLGVPWSNVLSGEVAADTIIVPEPAQCFRPNVHMLARLRQTLAASFELDMTPVWQRQGAGARVPQVLIVPRHKPPRKMRSPQRLARRLRAALGTRATVRVYTDAEMTSPRATLRAFNDATVVIGMYGANQANVLACRPGALVVEVMAPETRHHPVDPMYMLMATRMGLRYYGVGGAGYGHRDGVQLPMDEIVHRVQLFINSLGDSAAVDAAPFIRWNDLHLNEC